MQLLARESCAEDMEGGEDEERPPLPALQRLGGDNAPWEGKEADGAKEINVTLGALRHGMAVEERGATGFEPV